MRVMMNWFTAVLSAVLLNLLLFALMPELIRGIPKKSDLKAPVSAIQVIPFKRPETKPPKKEHREPPPQEKPKQRRHHQQQTPRMIPRGLVKQKLRLPFEFNPKLPVQQQALALPAIEKPAFDMPELKSTYGIHEIDSPLTPLVHMSPIYPLGAQSKAIEGWVKVRFLVDRTGGVDRVEIIEAKPTGIFDLSVRNCVSGWRFKPGTVEGVPVKTWVTTTIRFELEHS